MKKIVLSFLTLAMFSFLSYGQCEDPTNLAVDGITSSGADLTWEAGADQEEWEVLWVLEGEDPLEPTNVIGSATVTAESYTIEGLDAETAYDAYVRAICLNDDESDWVLVSFTTDEDAVVVCAEPTALAADVDGASATITWTAGGDEEEWEILWVLEGEDPLDETNHLGFETVTAATYTIEDLEAGDYDVYVRAVCAEDDESEWVTVGFTIDEDEEPSSILWEDNFDDATTWTFDNDGVTGAQYGWTITGTPVGWTLPRINSTSGGQFAELANGNPTANPGTQEVGVTYTMTNATPIALAAIGGSNEVTLEFQQYGATFNDLQEVLISTNGTTFTSVFDNSDREALTADGGAAYTNPELIRVNLAPFLATTPDELWIQFRWTSAFPSEVNPNAWVTYGWMIDDVRIVENFDYDLEVVSASWGSIGNSGDLLSYPRVPTQQATEVIFNASLANSGKSAQTGVTFSINVNQGATVETSAPLTLAPYATADAAVSFTPGANGSYSVARSVTSDFIDEDGDPSNNQLSNVSILVNDFIYARDNNTVSGSISNGTDGMEAGNMFDVFADQTAYGITFRLNGGANGTPAGTEVFVKLYRVAADFEFIDESAPVALAANQLNQFVTIPFSAPVQLSAGETYLAVVGSFEGGLVVSGAGSAPDQTVFLYDYGSATWFFTRTTAMVRLNFDPSLNTSEVIETVSAMNLYPNPTASTATIEFDLLNDNKVEVIVTDITGKVMAVNNLGQLNGGKQTTSIDASGFASGIYFVTVKTNDAKTTQRFVKQ